MSGPRPVRVTIERLVLDGVPPAQSAAVVAAFRAELARLIAGAVPATGAAAAASAGSPPPLVVPAAADATAAGRVAAAGVARAVGGITR